MKWLRKKDESATVPDDPATEKQVDYIIRLVRDTGDRSGSPLRRARIKGNPTSAASYSTLSRSSASMLIESLLAVAPATEAQCQSLAHNLDAVYTGLDAQEKSDLERARAIAVPSGHSGDPASYAHLTKQQASEALKLLIG